MLKNIDPETAIIGGLLILIVLLLVASLFYSAHLHHLLVQQCLDAHYPIEQCLLLKE